MTASSSIATVVRWSHLHLGPAPGWITALLLVGLLAAGGPGHAATLNAGDIVIADSQAAMIIGVNPVSGLQTPVASGGKLVTPVGIALGAVAVIGPFGGDLYVLDLGCCGPSGGQGGVIRVNLQTAEQTVLSFGDKLINPAGITISETGFLYVVVGNCCQAPGGMPVPGVIQVDPVTGHQTVVASGPPLQTPTGIVIATSGDPFVYVVDPGCCGGGGVIRVNPVSGTQTVVSPDHFFMNPQGIAIAGNGDQFVVDPGCCGRHGGVILVNPVSGEQMVVASSASPSSPFVSPQGIAIGSSGDVLVVDRQCCTSPGHFSAGGVIRVNPVNGTQTVLSQGQNFQNPFGIAVMPLRSAPAPVPSCGGDAPCSCGDRAVKDRKLRGADPVTKTVCPADGLVVASGVTLDLGGATLRGGGVGTGVRIEAGATHATVRNGTIAGFATGVHGESAIGVSLANVQVSASTQDGVTLSGDGHTLEKSVVEGSGGLGLAVVGHAARLSGLQVLGNEGAGVRLLGDGHVLEKSEMVGNAGRGAEVSGDRNQVAGLQVESNAGDGVLVKGTGNQVAKNEATRNLRNGLDIQGDRAAVEKNEATNNGWAGLEIHGMGHHVSSNVAEHNTGTGLQAVGTTGSQFERNKSENNRGFGIADDSTGRGTSGTANSYTKNVCGTGNARSASSPAGLCR